MVGVRSDVSRKSIALFFYTLALGVWHRISCKEVGYRQPEGAFLLLQRCLFLGQGRAGQGRVGQGRAEDQMLNICLLKAWVLRVGR